jgi:indolepyruvate ferredoxin oxidoreductase alpha subunit
MSTVLLSGNEAIARGAYEAGVHLAVAYPGTPSTEILENVALYPSILSQWGPNEKVAMEVAIGGSIGGGRTMVSMKHVGVNVAADPLFSFAYTGVNGGFVLISADDPGMHSSQNEQDNRIYAKFAKIGLLEPSDSQECKDFVKLAFDLSEQFDMPFMVRITTRVAHTKGLVQLEEPLQPEVRPYQKNFAKNITLPTNARELRVGLETRLQKLEAHNNTLPINRMEIQDRSLGIITSGISYQYVKEALPHVSVLKLGCTNPLPMKLISQFAEAVEELWVVEELEPFMETQISAASIPCIGSSGCIPFYGKDLLPRIGELSPSILREKILGISLPKPVEMPESPVRPPVLCPGCPHRGVFHTLRDLKAIVTGDIGCYTLGALSPLDAMDTTICMGASIPMALGMEKVHPELAAKIVAVIGDSTFFHSGMTGLVDQVYNGGTSTILLLDNSITAMTGHQQNPGTGVQLNGKPSPHLDFEAIIRALGVQRVQTVDAYDLAVLKKIIGEEMAVRELSVVIVKRECALISKDLTEKYHILPEKCVACKACLKIGCPAMSFNGKHTVIDSNLCVGCGVCSQLCRFGAIAKDVN